MFKKILCLVLIAALGVPACACGSDKGSSKPSGVVNSVESVSSNDTESTAAGQKAADAVLTLKVKKGETTAFKSDRPYDKSKQDISLILVVGQSNFTTSVGFSSEYQHFIDGKTDVAPEAPLSPAKGTVYSSAPKGSITALTDDRDVSRLCDVSNLTRTIGGVCPSFGYQWNVLTGTKVVFVQAAVGAVGVHEWTPDPENYYCECTNNGHGTLYADAVANYKRSYDALSEKYNIVYTGYIWNQGEHDEVFGAPGKTNTVNSDLAYYTAYKSMHDGFMAELNLDFGGISVVRADKAGGTAQGSMSLTIARNAQYKLCNDIDDLYMLSTISETCDHSMMDQSNTIHYAQATFNKMGVDCANNLAAYLKLLSEAPAFSGVELYSNAGIKICEFDASGKAVTDDGTCFVPKGYLSDHLLCKLKTLGTGDILTSFALTVGDKDMTGCIDEFGAISWDEILAEKPVKTVEIKCVIE